MKFMQSRADDKLENYSKINRNTRVDLKQIPAISDLFIDWRLIIQVSHWIDSDKMYLIETLFAF